MSSCVMGVVKSKLSIDGNPVFFSKFIEMEKYTVREKSSKEAKMKKTRTTNMYNGKVFYLILNSLEYMNYQEWVPIYKRTGGATTFPPVYSLEGMANSPNKEIVAWVKKSDKNTFDMKMLQEEPK